MKKFFIQVFDKILVLDTHLLSIDQFMQGVWQLTVIPAGSWELDKQLRALRVDQLAYVRMEYF